MTEQEWVSQVNATLKQEGFFESESDNPPPLEYSNGWTPTEFVEYSKREGLLTKVSEKA